MHHVDGALVDQLLEAAVECVDVLACQQRHVDGVLDLFEHVGVFPRDHVFQPSQRIRLQDLAQLDATVDADVAKMIRSDRDLPTDHFADLGKAFGHQRSPLVGQLDRGEGVFAPPVGLARRIAQRAGDVAHGLDAAIVLEERESLLDPFFQAGHLAIRRVGIQPDAVAVSTAQHLIHGHAVCLARQIPQRHLHAGDAAALPSMAAELPDLLEQPLHVARVLSQQAALEHQRVFLAGPVADFAIAADALIGVDANQRTAHRRPDHHRNPQVGNPQFRRTGIALDVLCRAGDLLFDGRVDHTRQSQAGKAGSDGLQHGTSRSRHLVLSLVRLHESSSYHDKGFDPVGPTSFVSWDRASPRSPAWAPAVRRCSS